jgi:hypothetical protein
MRHRNHRRESATTRRLACALAAFVACALVLARLSIPPVRPGAEAIPYLSIVWPWVAMGIAYCAGALVVFARAGRDRSAPLEDAEARVAFDPEEEFTNVDMDEEWERITRKAERSASEEERMAA